MLDYETRSEADLKKTGAIKYAEHPSTEVLCLAYKIDDRPTVGWSPFIKSPASHTRTVMRELYCLSIDPDVTWIAHNAPFEQAIFEHVFRRTNSNFPVMPPERWKCTAAKAAACALPRNLEGAALALDLAVKKNMDGRRLMLKYMKPTRKWIKWKLDGKGDEPAKWHDDEMELWAIQDYCKTDVEAEYLLDRALPDLIPSEREIWLLNQSMNMRGVQIDMYTTRHIVAMMAEHSKVLQARVGEITGGAVKSALQVGALLDWLDENGATLPDLRAGTVREVLAEYNLDANTAEVLKIRQALSKTSTKKYHAMIARASADGRVRDNAMYHGASTGRESGTGIQVHNLPKGSIKNTDLAIDCIRSAILDSTGTYDIDWIECLYGDPMEVFSSCVRGMITASMYTGREKWELFAADYSAIEARVLAWLASDETALNTFRRNEDPYIKMACWIFNCKPEEVTRAMRQIGKIAELGLGYQMGAKKFLATCHSWGVTDVTEEIAARAVTAYREAHAPITRMWPNIERAAIMAVQMPRKVIKLNRLAWAVEGGFLWCQLPSGRKLRYYGPTIRQELTPWGSPAPKLYHWGVNPLTKKWECAATYGGKLVENITQAVARDITMAAALKMERAEYRYLFQVHDEIVAERIKGRGSVAEFTKILTTLPPWAAGLPIVAEGWNGPRYKK